MPWYFYGPDSKLVTSGPIGTLSAGAIILSPIPYTSTEPVGFLFCNGQSVLKNDYLDLFGEVGTLYGSININEFNVPDFRARIPRGIISSGQGIGSISGVGGSTSHAHTLANHTHPISLNHSHTGLSHTHSFSNHTHTLNNHTHPNGSLGVAVTTRTYPDTDTIEPPTGSGTLTSQWDHQHSNIVSGDTGNPVEITFANTTSDGGGSLDSNSPGLTAANLVGNSNLGGSGTTTSANSIPPYLTLSFLIKT